MAFFDSIQKEKIKTAIEKAEHQTSGEIRVCVEKNCTIDPISRAAYFFKKLKMNKTEHRNGVLIYLAHEDKKFAIIGDSGIHRHAGDDFWQEVKEIMLSHFKTGKIQEGIVEAVLKTGHKLKKFFPFEENKKNELSDDVYDRG
jgi:uncharacterized membrane protein